MVEVIREGRGRIDDELYEEILVEASKRLREFSSGVRGQVVRKEDGLDYWIAQVAWEWARENEK